MIVCQHSTGKLTPQYLVACSVILRVVGAPFPVPQEAIAGAVPRHPDVQDVARSPRLAVLVDEDM